MNYRHIFHAGNRCDIVKHSVLTLLVGALRVKTKGFVVLDTHAGVGIYDLLDPRALKTHEAADGILRLLASPSIASLSDYYAVLQLLNPSWKGSGSDKFRVYPGSPILSFHMLRDQDRLIACELHPEDASALRACAPADKRLQIHNRNGYEALGAFLPPPEKRGLIFIDPPFESTQEFETIVDYVTIAYQRWPSGIFMIWYPIKDRTAIWRFQDAWQKSGIDKILCAEFMFQNEEYVDHLNGSGLILINPPWKIDVDLHTLFPKLHEALQTESDKQKIFWLVD